MNINVKKNAHEQGFLLFVVVKSASSEFKYQLISPRNRPQDIGVLCNIY